MRKTPRLKELEKNTVQVDKNTWYAIHDEHPGKVFKITKVIRRKARPLHDFTKDLFEAHTYLKIRAGTTPDYKEHLTLTRAALKPDDFRQTREAFLYFQKEMHDVIKDILKTGQARNPALRPYDRKAGVPEKIHEALKAGPAYHQAKKKLDALLKLHANHESLTKDVKKILKKSKKIV